MFLYKIYIYKNTYNVKINKINELAGNNIIVDK
jgi:hypothetical protein